MEVLGALWTPILVILPAGTAKVSFVTKFTPETKLKLVLLQSYDRKRLEILTCMDKFQDEHPLCDTSDHFSTYMSYHTSYTGILLVQSGTEYVTSVFPYT